MDGQEIRYELSGTLGVDAVTRFDNVLIKNYMATDTQVCCEARILMPNDDVSPFYNSYKAAIASCGLIAYEFRLGMGITTYGEGIPKGYFEPEEKYWHELQVDRGHADSLHAMYKAVDLSSPYHVQALLYYAKYHRFKIDDDYEAVMNIVRFMECVVLGIRRAKGQAKDVDVKLGPITNQHYLLDLGVKEEELGALLEVNGLRNQLVGHGLLSPEIEELFGLEDQSKNMPKYYISTPGPTYGIGHYTSKRMYAVDRLFQLYFGF